MQLSPMHSWPAQYALVGVWQCRRHLQDAQGQSEDDSIRNHCFAISGLQAHCVAAPRDALHAPAEGNVQALGELLGHSLQAQHLHFLPGVWLLVNTAAANTSSADAARPHSSKHAPQDGSSAPAGEQKPAEGRTE